MSPPTGSGPIRVKGRELGRRPERMTAVRALAAAMSATTAASTHPKARALGVQSVTDVADHGRLPAQARLTGRSDQVVYRCATRVVATATQGMTVTGAQTTDRARGRDMALLMVMAPRLATAHRAGRPEITARTPVAGRLDQTACRPLEVALVRAGR
jgi:hypothetical protein